MMTGSQAKINISGAGNQLTKNSGDCLREMLEEAVEEWKKCSQKTTKKSWEAEKGVSLNTEQSKGLVCGAKTNWFNQDNWEKQFVRENVVEKDTNPPPALYVEKNTTNNTGKQHVKIINNNTAG